MNIILLSGGSGKRLWPLSNDVRSKQFIRILETSNGIRESMVQRVFRQIKSVDPSASVTIATSRSQVSAIHNQLGEKVNVSVEPCRRDTFPAIALATAYLHDICGINENDVVVVCPVDPYVNDDYFVAIKQLYEMAKAEYASLCLLGIDPTYPSEKYGYILPENREEISRVLEFKEKPNAVTAQRYIDAGGLWNGGVFAYKLSYVLNRTQELTGVSEYDELLECYESLNSISFDYAVAEQEKNIAVLRFHGQWMDLGTWNTLTEAMRSTTIGDVRLADDCINVHALNELGIPILALGLNDVVIAASPEGILVSDKEKSSYLKAYVDQIDQRVMFAEKSWGSYRVIDVEEDSMSVKVTLNPGNRMNYHSHMHRDEVWTVISGSGTTIIDGMEQPVVPGDVITMAAGCKHTVIAGESGLKIIEVQLGREINVTDKQKYKIDNEQ